MTARAASTAATADRILDGAMELWAQAPIDQVRLEALAAAAGVTVPTVTRRFGGKPGVYRALVERELGRLASRGTTFAGASVEAIAAYFVDYYEAAGPLILKLYAEAPLVPGLPELATEARMQHVASIEAAFADRLRGGQELAPRRLGQVIAILDATTWRILRLERRLPAAEVRAALTEMLEPLVT